MKRIILIAMMISMMSFVSADVLIQMPQITVSSGQTSTFGMIIQNTFNFSVSNFTFSNLTGFSFQDISIAPNSNVTTYFNVTRSDAGSRILNSLVSFKYYVNIPQGIHTYYINITNTGGFSPDNIVVRKGDTVTWTNRDEVSRGVTSSFFDYNVMPNQSVSYTFLQTGNYPYQDLVYFFGGNIQVINETEATLVNNPSYNVNLPINLLVTTNPTNISVSNNQNNYVINATGQGDGFMIVTNTGTEIASQVHLGSSLGWVAYDSNDFNLNPGQSTSVNYHIKPIIFQTSDTNKTYTLTLQVNGQNFGEIDSAVDIFVPYDSSFQDINTNEGSFALYMRICGNPANSHLLICNNTINMGGNGTTIVQNPMINLNMTTEQFLAMLKRQQTLMDTSSRAGNRLDIIDNKIGNIDNRLSNLENLANKSVSMQEKNEGKSSTWELVWIFNVFFITIFGTVWWILRKNAQFNKRKSIIDSGVPVH